MRVEVRNESGDKDYVNAIECADEDEANELASQARSQGFHVKVNKGGGSGDGSAEPKKKSSAKKTASKKAVTGQSGTGSNSQKGEDK